MKQKLPSVDLRGFKGLFTYPNPEVIQAEQLRIAENCDFFETLMALAKVKGNTKILSSPYQEGGVTKTIPWIDFYKTSRLDGPITRQVLCAAGTKLCKLDGSSLTVLKNDRTPDLFHTAAQLGRFMYISNYDPDKVGVGDDLVKYDGAVISQWGLTAPGTQETVLEGFENVGDWAVVNALASTETEITIDGTNAISLDKTGTTDRIFSIEKDFDTPFYVTADQRDTSFSAGNRIFFWTFIPRGELTDDCLETNSFDPYEAAMAVWISPDTGTVENSHWKFYFQIGELVEGWNRLNLNFSGSPQGLLGDFYPDADAVRRARFDFRLESAENTKSGIVLDRFVQLDEGTPIPTPQGSGTFTGAYSYRVTFVSKYGAESNAGPASAIVPTSSHGSVFLTNIPVSDDPQVTARRIYRTVAGGSIYLFLDQINNNKYTTYVDETPDGSLGVTTPPQLGDFSDDNSPPPKGGIVQTWKRTLFIAGDPQNPETLYFSEDDEPESFPVNNAFTLDDKITGIYEVYSALVVETETSKWQLIGDNPDFSLDKIIDNMGCVGRRATGMTKKIGYSVDRDGLRIYDGTEPLKISEPIRDKYDNEINKQNIELIHTVHSKDKNTLLQFNPDGTTPIPKYSSIFAYNYPIDDIPRGWWSTLEIPSDINILDAVEVEDDNGDFHLYCSSEEGMIYEFFVDGQMNWTNASGTETAIKTKFQTPFLRLGDLGINPAGDGEKGTDRVVPRWVELRLKDNTAINWTVTLEAADGADDDQEIRDTKTITLDFNENESLVRQAVPMGFNAGSFIRFTVETEEVDTYAVLLGMQVQFHVRSFEGERNVRV